MLSMCTSRRPNLDDDDEPDFDGDEVHVAVIGRPNVGKSSLVNRLVGDSRVLVSEVPGTTRDAVDVICEVDGVRFRFVDTAGIRRKGRTDKGPEVLSVVVARRHLERAQICLVLIDAVEGITRQDGHVAGYAWEAGRGVVLVVNKWDLVTNREEARADLIDQMDQNLKFLRQTPHVFLSALTGKGVHRLFPVMQTGSPGARDQGFYIESQSSDQGCLQPQSAVDAGSEGTQDLLLHPGSYQAATIRAVHESGQDSALFVDPLYGERSPRGVLLGGCAVSGYD